MPYLHCDGLIKSRCPGGNLVACVRNADSFFFGHSHLNKTTVLFSCIKSLKLQCLVYTLGCQMVL